MDKEPQEPQEQPTNSPADRIRAWQFKPGQSGNPGGRPKGSVSLKEYARSYLMGLSDEEKLGFMKGLNKVDIWKLAEGNPKQDTESNVIVTLPKPIIPLINALQGNNSNEENNITEEED